MRHDGQFLLESDDESLEFVDLLPGLSQLLLELGDLLLKLPLFLLQFLATLQVRGSRYNRERSSSYNLSLCKLYSYHDSFSLVAALSLSE